MALSTPSAQADEPDPAAIRQAVTLYASYDQGLEADVAGGVRTLDTRTGSPGKPETYRYSKGYDQKVYTIASGQGVAGGALDANDVLADNGRMFYPMKGNLAYRAGGWGGSLSMWINTDPHTRLKTKFCDPVQITEKGANNGGLWIDFNDRQPRDMRMGAFSAVPDGQTGIGEGDPNAPLIIFPGVTFKQGEWHHLVMTWDSFDTGRPDAQARFYVDGQLVGTLSDRPIAMGWDVERAGIYVAVNYIGLIDEFALFNRSLSAAEVGLLRTTPGLLQPIKQAKSPR